MRKAYLATGHHLTKKLADSNVIFPISKAELLNKVGEEIIKVDFDKCVSIKEYCSNISIDYFNNKEQFFCALNASNIVY